MSEPRAIWCVLHNGVPAEWKWALVRAPVEVDLAALPAGVRASKASDAQKIGWASALTVEQAADPAYDATPSGWRRVPLLAQPGAGGQRSLVGRAIEVDGVRLHLDDRGRPHPDSRSDNPREPLEPDVEIVDQAALDQAARRLGRDVRLTERGTGRSLRGVSTSGKEPT